MLNQFMCVDRFDLPQTSTGEHLCRRLLQVQAAVKRNPKMPDFEGLEPYLDHVGEASSPLSASSFEAHVASTLKDKAAIMRQMRLAKEEKEAVDAKKKKEAGKGAGKGTDPREV